MKPANKLPLALTDPRRASGFNRRHFPLIDGVEAPTQDVDEIVSRKLPFAFLYYYLNEVYAELLRVRAKRLNETDTLQRIEELLILRGNLEDRMARHGIYAEPIIESGFTVDLLFCAPPPDEPSIYSAFVAVPLPPRLTRKSTA